MTDLAHLPPLTEEAMARIREIAAAFAEMSIDPPSPQAIHRLCLKDPPDTHDEWRELNEGKGI